MTVKELYDRIGGDYADVLKRLPNDAFISVFIKKYIDADDFDKMIDAFERKDYKSLFMASHNLKGMSANMGLSKIQTVVSEICEAVRHGDPATDITPLIEQAKEDQCLLIELVKQL